VLFGELAVQVLLSIPVGLALGWLLSLWLARMFDSELYRIPVVIAPSTFGWAVLVVLAAATATALVVRRRIDRLDLVGVLKTRE